MKCFLALSALIVLSAGLRAADPPGTRIIKVVSVYTFADGRQVVVEESTDAPKGVADRPPQKIPCEVQATVQAKCSKCGDSCNCVGGCGCDATSQVGTCAAAPKVAQAPPPVYSAPPVYTYPAHGGYYGGGYYAPMPQSRPVLQAGWQVQGPFGGGFQAQACVGGR